MALPNGIQTVTVTFGAAGVLGVDEPLAMKVTFTASVNAIWAATGQPFLRKPQTALASVGGTGAIVLISPDQAGFINGNGDAISNWTYQAVIEYIDALGKTVTTITKNFAYLTSQGSPIDLDLTVPVSTSSGVIVDIAPGGGIILPPGGVDGQVLGLVNGSLGWITIGSGSVVNQLTTISGDVLTTISGDIILAA